MKKFRLKLKIFTFCIVILIFAFYILILLNRKNSAQTDLDIFAQCLTQSGVVMYGADWCSHCKNEKKAFGDSFRLVNYVECPDNPNLCLEKEIKGYPTWVFPSGKKLEGEQGLENLSRESGCTLPD